MSKKHVRIPHFSRNVQRILCQKEKPLKFDLFQGFQSSWKRTPGVVQSEVHCHAHWSGGGDKMKNPFSVVHSFMSPTKMKGFETNNSDLLLGEQRLEHSLENCPLSKTRVVLSDHSLSVDDERNRDRGHVTVAGDHLGVR